MMNKQTIEKLYKQHKKFLKNEDSDYERGFVEGIKTILDYEVY